MNIHWKISDCHKPPLLTSFRLTRRDLVVNGFKLALLGVLGAGSGFSRMAQAGNPLGQKKSRHILQSFMDTLIPADPQSPSASQLGVMEDIQGIMKNDALFSRLINTGIQWLDINTQGRFDTLSIEDRESVLHWMEQQQYDTIPRRFLEIVRDQVMLFYYSKPESYHGLAIEGPPQPIGYPAPVAVKFP